MIDKVKVGSIVAYIYMAQQSWARGDYREGRLAAQARMGGRMNWLLVVRNSML